MKVKDLLTTQEKLTLLNGTTVGFFNYVITNADVYISEQTELCKGFYLERSANRTLSPFIEYVIKLAQEDNTVNVNETVGNYIRAKFKDKWTKIYNTLMEEYSILDNFTMNTQKDGEDSVTDTYNNTIEDDGNSGTNIVTTTESTDQDNTFGFNSTQPVPTDTSTNNSTETTVGDKNANTTHNTKTKTGSDTEEKEYNETVTRSGRTKSGAEMITAELDVRGKYIFYDIVLADIDSVATLAIYC